jgi:hypothetical protein
MENKAMIEYFTINKWVELPTILQEGLNYISENQDEKYKYTHDDFTSVLFNELS